MAWREKLAILAGSGLGDRARTDAGLKRSREESIIETVVEKCGFSLQLEADVQSKGREGSTV